MPKAIGKYKVCSKCKKKKLLSEFTKDKYSPDGLRYWCKNCQQLYNISSNKKEYQRKRRKDNPTLQRGYDLMHHFGMSLEDYNKMFVEQRGVCVICDLPETKKQKGKIQDMSVDHNHQTGKVRQLLCNRCNTLLGFVDENIEILESAIKYLKEYNG